MEIFVVAWVLMGILAAMIASSKGLSVGGYGCAGVLLGPIGILAAIFATPKVAATSDTQARVPCDQCAEMILPAAQTCRFCGVDRRDRLDEIDADAANAPPTLWQKLWWNPTPPPRR